MGASSTGEELGASRSGRQRRQLSPPGRHRRDPARPTSTRRGSGAPPGPGGDRAGHLDGQGRRHHRAGQALRRGRAKDPPELPVGIELRQVQDQSTVAVSALGQRVRRVLIEAVVIVLAVSFISLGCTSAPRPGSTDLARPGGGHHDPAGAGHHLRDHVLLGRGSAQDLAGLADHRAGPAGGRRHHRRSR